MDTIEPVELLPPGAFIEEELEARGWSQQDLADVLKRPARLISELVNGKRGVTVETARGLSKAFGTSVELWLNLQRDFEVARSRPREPEEQAAENAVARRARLFTLLPIREMARRGWVQDTMDVGQLEGEICRLAACQNLSELEKCLPHAARKSGPAELSPPQRAWLLRARQLARVPVPGRFVPKDIPRLYERLRTLLNDAAEARHAPRLLGEAGIRMVVIEPIPGSKLDGACFWLNDQSPVVALSLRLDRFDSFWFTLRHELDHIEHGEGKGGTFVVDEDVGSAAAGDADHEDLPEEHRANTNAGDFVVPRSELDGFIARVKPYYSEERVIGFARRMKVHPGIVVGQLQKHGGMPHSNLRKFIEKIRPLIIPVAVTDGWGVTPDFST